MPSGTNPMPAVRAGVRFSWTAVVVVLAALAVGHGFSLDRVFYLRDLAGYFWPHHLWLRRTLWSGDLPLWAPEPGLGYPTIADPNLQLLFPLTIVGRVLLPDVLGFNLMVVLPTPLASLGAFFLMRRRFEGGPAAVGALVFALSGPFLSTLSTPNLSASAALAPWLVLAVDRFVEESSVRRGVALAVVVAMTALAGEPLTMVTAAVLAVLFAVTVAERGPDGRGLGRIAAGVCGWAAAGILLSAAQILPALEAVSRSARGAGRLIDGWSIHPLALLETVTPGLFGSPVDTVSSWSPWVFPLNGGREPFLGSLYIGVGTIAVATLGAVQSERRRWVWFWSLVVLVSLVLALGYFTPIYPGVRSTIPFFTSLRYPAKFAVFAALAVACLVAAGLQALWLGAHRVAGPTRLLPVGVSATLTGIGLLALGAVVLAPHAATWALQALAGHVGVSDGRSGAAYLASSIGGAAPRLIVLSAGSAFLLWVAGRGAGASRIARLAVPVMIVADLLAANSSLNPTIPTSWVSEPAWVGATRSRPEARVHAGQTALLPPGDREIPKTVTVTADTPAPVATALVATALGTFPMAWGVRSALTADLTNLRPSGYRTLVERFVASDRDARLRYLRRVGTRYYLALEPPLGVGPPLASLDPLVPMFLYEDPHPRPRARVVTAARVVQEPGARIAALFAPDVEEDGAVLLADPPPAAAGVSGAGAATPEARIMEESATTMRIAAAAPTGGGFLVVSDSYDPNWRVDIDGIPAPLLEADGVLRAVHIAPGRHVVTFRYRSRPLLVGLTVSAATALALAAGCLVRGGPSPVIPAAARRSG